MLHFIATKKTKKIYFSRLFRHQHTKLLGSKNLVFPGIVKMEVKIEAFLISTNQLYAEFNT
jgi:hypothetical protein